MRQIRRGALVLPVLPAPMFVPLGEVNSEVARCIRISGDDVRRVLEHLFKTIGLPKAIGYDGGPPFASATSLARLSRLSAWWV